MAGLIVMRCVIDINVQFATVLLFNEVIDSGCYTVFYAAFFFFKIILGLCRIVQESAFIDSYLVMYYHLQSINIF